MYRLLSAAALAVLLAGPAAADPNPAIERLKKDLYYLAGEECEGRGLETQGIWKAGEYIAEQFRKAGLKPAGTDGTYFQPFTVPGTPRLGTPNTLVLTGPDGARLDLKYGTDFTPTAMTAGGKTRAGMVFVGYGITAEKLHYDDYAVADVEGKWVVVLRRTPRADDQKAPFDPDPSAPLGAISAKLATAAKNKAAGVIFVNDAGYAANEGKNDDPLMDFGYRAGPAAKVPVLHLKRAVLEKLLAAQGKKLAAVETAIDKDLQPRSFELTGWTAMAEVTVEKPTIACRNVVAVAEGSGSLADETVVIGAHYDHLGRGESGSLAGPADRKKVHYGADDNASGTTGLIELARRFGAEKGRVGRRVVFVAFSGEEQGLYGSQHYCKEPPFPLDKTVFMVNLDMIGRPPRVDDAAGLIRTGPVLGAAAGWTTPNAVVQRDQVEIQGGQTAVGLDKFVAEVGRKFDFKVVPVAGGYGPSDHTSFYTKKVPVLFFFTGTHRDYHRPTDTPDKINYERLKQIVDMAEVFVAHYAQSAERPKYVELKQPTRRTRGGGPKLGVMPGNYNSSDGGVLVQDVIPGGAAAKGGMKAQDVIVEIAGKPIADINAYMAVMAQQTAGKEIEVVVVRSGKKVKLKVVPQQ